MGSSGILVHSYTFFFFFFNFIMVNPACMTALETEGRIPVCTMTLHVAVGALLKQLHGLLHQRISPASSFSWQGGICWGREGEEKFSIPASCDHPT